MSDLSASPGPGPTLARASDGNPLPPPPWPAPGGGSPAGGGSTGGGALPPPTHGPAPATPPTRNEPAAPPGGGPPPGEDDDDDGFHPPPWVFVVVPLLIVALAALLIWRNASDSGESSPSVSPTTAFSTIPGSTEPVTGLGGTDSTGSGTNPNGGTNPISGTTGPGPAPTSATTAVGTATTTPSATSIAPGGTGPLPAPPTAPATTTVADRAVRTAQAVASALANGDWDAVRRMSPTDQRTNSQFERDYAGLESSTVVLAQSTPLSSGLVDLRLGLVAHESRSSGPQTSLYCTHWIVDPVDSTVQRLDAALVRTVGGTVPAGQVSDELATTCASMPLR